MNFDIISFIIGFIAGIIVVIGFLVLLYVLSAGHEDEI